MAKMAVKKSFGEIHQKSQFHEAEKKDVTDESRIGIASIFQSLDEVARELEKIPGGFFKELFLLPEINIDCNKLKAKILDCEGSIVTIRGIQLGDCQTKRSDLKEDEFIRLAYLEKAMCQYSRFVDILVKLQTMVNGKELFRHMWPKELRQIVEESGIVFQICDHQEKDENKCLRCQSIVCPECSKTDFFRTTGTGLQICRYCGYPV